MNKEQKIELEVAALKLKEAACLVDQAGSICIKTARTLRDKRLKRHADLAVKAATSCSAAGADLFNILQKKARWE